MTWRRVAACLTGAVLGLVLIPVTGSLSATAAPPRPLAVAGTSAAFHALTPTRLADTRRSFGTAPAGRLAAGGTVSVQVTGRPEVSVPAFAVAVVLNVTAADAGGEGFLTVFPDGNDVPNASNLNTSGPGYVGANLVTVALGSNGAVAVFSSVASDLLVDVAGYYAPVSGPVAAGRTIPSGPTRLYDSRTLNGGTGAPLRAGEVRTITLDGLPSTAAAAVLNLTVTRTVSPGFWSVIPPGAPLDENGAPTTSSLNVTSAGATSASQVIVPIGADHRVQVYTSGGGELLLDLFGYVTDGSSTSSTVGLFVPLAVPYRMLDTRTTNSPLGNGHRTWPGWSIEVPVAGRGGVPASGVAAVVGNLTSVDPHGAGWVADYPAGTPFPGTSTLNNDRAGMVVPNHTFTPISGRGVSILAAAGGHLLLDVSGYFTGTAAGATESTPVNAMPIPAFPMTISIPAIGLSAPLQADAEENDLVDGPGWWPGTAYPGVTGNMAIFGHRTEHTAPFRRLNQLKPGDTITITGDHRTSVYVVEGGQVVVAADTEDHIGPSDRTLLTLIACSRPDGTPTSLKYRIIVTATLLDYRDT